MGMWTTRLGMSLMVVVGFWTNRASAQQICYVPSPEVVLVPYFPYEPARHPPGPPIVGKPAPIPAQHCARRVANHFGMGCQDDYFYPTCGSWRYEMHFMFSSCRWFFEQRCDPFQPCADHRNGARTGYQPYYSRPDRAPFAD